MNALRSSALSLALGLLAACARTQEIPPETHLEVASRAKAALIPFKRTLKHELTTALEASPRSAIDVCAKRAPELAKEATKDGVVVGRSAFKLRSEANAAQAWLVPVMAELSRVPPGSEEHRIVKLDHQRFGYVEPIWVAAQCTVCHGETVAPEIEQALSERYPNDKARGFGVGDFRGVFWAEVSRTP